MIDFLNLIVLIYYVNEILINYSMALDTVFSFNQQGIYSRGLQSQNFTFGFFSSEKNIFKKPKQ